MSADDRPIVKGLFQILPYVWLGNGDLASEKDELTRLKVTDVFNCASEDVDNFFPDDFKYHQYPIEDTHDFSPAPFFEPFFEAMSAVKENKGIAFVHCTTGKNIGPAMILSYMMKSSKNQNKHLPLIQAIKYVSGKAPGVNPEEQFMSDLIDLEEELFEEASVKLKTRRSAGGGRGGHSRGKGKRGK